MTWCVALASMSVTLTLGVLNIEDTCDFTMPVGPLAGEHCEVSGMKPKCCTFVQAMAACSFHDDVDSYECVQHARSLDPGNCPVLDEFSHHPSDYCLEAVATLLSAPSTEKQETCDFFPPAGPEAGEHCEVSGMKPKCCTFVQAIAACPDDDDNYECEQHARSLNPGNCPVLREAIAHLSDYCLEAVATLLSAPSTEKQTLLMTEDTCDFTPPAGPEAGEHCEISGLKPKCCNYVQAMASCAGRDHQFCHENAYRLNPGNCSVLGDAMNHLSDYCLEAVATLLSVPSSVEQLTDFTSEFDVSLKDFLYGPEQQILLAKTVNQGAQQQPWMVALLAGVAGMTGGAVVLALRRQGRDPPLLSEA